MIRLNTTREERDKYVSGRDKYPLFNDKELAEDCNTIEDKLDCVRERLEVTERKLVAMTVQGARYMTSAEELEKENNALRERLDAAERELAQLKKKDMDSYEPVFRFFRDE